MSITKLDVVAAVVGLYVLQRYLSQKGSTPLPPGPRGLPLIGNVADMPSKREWVTFAEWGRKWGGICSVRLMGRSMVIVNSSEIMDELDKQGAIYSDRPRLEMGGELVGYKDTLVLLPYGARFRSFRKYFSNFLGPIPMENHVLTVEHESHRFLKRVLTKPNDLMTHLRKLAGGIILKLTYGIEVQEGDDPFVDLIENANHNFSAATVPGAFLVDFFPALRQLPEWLPGMGFMKTARIWAQATADMIEVPFAFTQKNMDAGTAPPSFVLNILEEDPSLSGKGLRDLKFAASSMYGGGADTTVSAEYAFFLAMVLNSDVQKKAQAEIDSVIGNDRLPGLADRPHLPYVNAVLTEVLRWNSVAPTGVPHTAIEDGIINGYLIPKGSIIIANLWNMLHDPDTYPDPFDFNPDRHIATAGREAQRDPRHVCFGYGRRICPGMHLAEASLFCAIVMSLAVFDITKTVENGIEITPVHANTSGIISYPEPYKCTIKPRSERVVSLIAQEHNF
ncbi:OrdA protein [Collybia nuda]|uniref:OrdA protein n=1 Tax=Collybia nuda TaxID=64659 RepID=A0A9P5Y5R5_9AGAR|nr:OrdA protein [Collybia nuda]